MWLPGNQHTKTVMQSQTTEGSFFMLSYRSVGIEDLEIAKQIHSSPSCNIVNQCGALSHDTNFKKFHWGKKGSECLHWGA